MPGPVTVFKHAKRAYQRSQGLGMEVDLDALRAVVDRVLEDAAECADNQAMEYQGLHDQVVRDAKKNPEFRAGMAPSMVISAGASKAAAEELAKKLRGLKSPIRREAP